MIVFCETVKAIQMPSIYQTRKKNSIFVTGLILSLKWPFKFKTHKVIIFTEKLCHVHLHIFFFSKAVVIKHNKQISYVPKFRNLYAPLICKIRGHSPDFFLISIVTEAVSTASDWPARNQQQLTCHSLNTEFLGVCTAWRTTQSRADR